MTVERPCRIYTTNALDIDLEEIDLIKYRREKIDMTGQKAEEPIATAYAYVHGLCVRVIGETAVRELRTAWRAYKSWQPHGGGR